MLESRIAIQISIHKFLKEKETHKDLNLLYQVS